LTGYFQFFYDRYELLGPNLVDELFLAAPDQSAAASPAAITLRNDNPEHSATLTQRLIPGPGVSDIRAVIDARVIDVTAGIKPWNTARVVLASIARGETQPDYSRPHELVGLIGTTDWTTYSRTFHIYPHIVELRLQAQLMQATGVLEFRQFTIHAAKLRAEWPWLQGLLIGSLLMFIGAVFAPYRRDQKRTLLPLAALAGVASIVLFTAMPAGTKNAWIS